MGVRTGVSGSVRLRPGDEDNEEEEEEEKMTMMMKYMKHKKKNLERGKKEGRNGGLVGMRVVA
jgi:hypothetical protein